MGVCCVIIRLKDETIDELVAAPGKVHHFYSPDDLPPSRPVGLIGKLLGVKPQAPQLCSATRRPGDEVDLDKSWDGIDFLLSKGRRDGGIARLLTTGGITIREEVGYGMPQAAHSDRVKAYADYLASMPPEEIRGSFDPEAMIRQDVYPAAMWKGGDDSVFEDYLLPNYESLRAFIKKTAELGEGILIVAT